MIDHVTPPRYTYDLHNLNGTTALQCGCFLLLSCQFYTGARLQFNKGIVITVFGGSRGRISEGKIHGSLFQPHCVPGRNVTGADLIHN